MPRIEKDPTEEVCPDYRRDEYQQLRNIIVGDVQEGREEAEEQAARRLEEAWQTAHRRQVADWEAQQEADAEDRRRQEEEEEERRREEEERARVEEEERKRKEEERRQRTKKVFVWDNDKPVGSTLVNRPAQYALNKLAAITYIEIDYFTLRGCGLAQREKQTTNADAVGVTQLEGHLSLQPMSALKPVKGIRADEDLTWAEITQARHAKIQQMLKLGDECWPNYAVEGWSDFYAALDAHAIRQEEYGDEAVVLYHARVRREWYDMYARGQGMNPGIISEELLRNIRQEIVTKKGIEAYKEVSTIQHED